MTPLDHVQTAAARDDVTWWFFWCMSEEDREAFDRWLVETEDPLAYEPGTTERRFREKVRQCQEQAR